MNSAFIGLSHLGLVTSICFASLKNSVFAIDQNLKLIEDLKRSKIPLSEPDLTNIFQKSKKFYTPSSDFSLVAKCDFVFISLDTPLNKPESLGKIETLIKKTIPFLKDNVCLIILSQVPVGFTRRLENKIKKKKPSFKFNLYYLLNTLIIGESVERFMNPERIILGSSNPSNALHPEFLRKIKKFKCPIINMNFESAEMTKTAVNLFLASSITTANTISDYCEVVGADYSEIIPALKLDKRIGPYAYLKPTLRISGGHIERELIKVNKLHKTYHVSEGIEKSLTRLNIQRMNWLYKKIRSLKPKTITLWGLSYKKNSDQTENASSIEIIKTFGEKTLINTYDPAAAMPKSLKNYKRFTDKLSALHNSDLLIILTDWEEFKIQNPDGLNVTTIIDCVGILYSQIHRIKKTKYACMGVSYKSRLEFSNLF